MIPTRPCPQARSKNLRTFRAPVRSHVATKDTTTLNASTLSTISLTLVYLPASLSARAKTPANSGRPSHASRKYLASRSRSAGSRSSRVACVLRQFERIGNRLSSDSENGAADGSSGTGGGGGGGASSPWVPSMNRSSMASPTSVVHFIGRSPPSVFLLGVRRSAPSRSAAQLSAAATVSNVSSANPRWSLPRSRFSFGRAGPNTAICVRLSSPS
mmetsp:Transcript_7337/g.32371  ORF Transcript_7337/g.32371 Transcript_7337/m.32371 type:complete len:215 (-) Transcript_7337:319-963(-)